MLLLIRFVGHDRAQQIDAFLKDWQVLLKRGMDLLKRLDTVQAGVMMNGGHPNGSAWSMVAGATAFEGMT
jgi:hypothetical protein